MAFNVHYKYSILSQHVEFKFKEIENVVLSNNSELLKLKTQGIIGFIADFLPLHAIAHISMLPTDCHISGV